MTKSFFNPFITVLIILMSTGLAACQGNKQNTADSTQSSTPAGGSVSVEEFDKQLATLADGQLVDVRTPGEFGGGHLKDALNMNINSSDFEQQINTLDKTKPVFVYCLAGSRSASAANYMRKQGFSTVYEMSGGILKWKAAGKPLETGSAQPKKQGMSVDEFNQKVNTDKYVLVDYHAKWCKPCIKMAPILDKVATDIQDKLILLKVDADENEALLKAKSIEDIPVLELYQNGKVIWKHKGFIDEETLLKETKL